MEKHSSGIMMYRRTGDKIEILLVHPGGPFWAKKDQAAWSIPKGEHSEDENPLDAAIREFHEETGFSVSGDFIDLGEVKQPNRKIIHAWTIEGDCNPEELASNTFEIEWPPKSGRFQNFPEVDRAAWFSPSVARTKLHKGQVVFVDLLLSKLGQDDTSSSSGEQSSLF